MFIAFLRVVIVPFDPVAFRVVPIRLAHVLHVHGGDIFPYLLLLNPTDVFRILNVFSTEDVFVPLR